MFVTQTITTVLPSQEIKPFSLSDDNNTIIQSLKTLVNVYKTNRLIIIETPIATTVVSEDGLTRTNTRTFTDQEAFDAFMAEPAVIAFFEARNNYNTDNGITSTIVIA